MALKDRLAMGTPLRIVELARYIGYSREQVRKWLDSGTLRAARPTPGGRRRIPVEEAARIARECGLAV